MIEEEQVKKELTPKKFIKKYIKNVIVNAIIISIVIYVFNDLFLGFVNDFIFETEKIPFLRIVLAGIYFYFWVNNVWISAVREIFVKNYILPNDIKAIRKKIIVSNMVFAIVGIAIGYLPNLISLLFFKRLLLNIFGDFLISKFITDLVSNIAFYLLITVFCIDVFERESKMLGYKKNKYAKRKILILLLCVIIFIWSSLVKTYSVINQNKDGDVSKQNKEKLEKVSLNTEKNIENFGGEIDLKIYGTYKGLNVNESVRLSENRHSDKKREVFVLKMNDGIEEKYHFVIENDKFYEMVNDNLIPKEKILYERPTYLIGIITMMHDLKKDDIIDAVSNSQYVRYTGDIYAFFMDVFLEQAGLNFELEEDGKCKVDLLNDEYIKKIHCQFNGLTIESNHILNLAK